MESENRTKNCYGNLQTTQQATPGSREAFSYFTACIYRSGAKTSILIGLVSTEMKSKELESLLLKLLRKKTRIVFVS